MKLRPLHAELIFIGKTQQRERRATTHSPGAWGQSGFSMATIAFPVLENCLYSKWNSQSEDGIF